jgi:hypothetical protein
MAANATVRNTSDTPATLNWRKKTVTFARWLTALSTLVWSQGTTWTTTLASFVTLPNGGTIPPGTYSSQSNMFTYLFGPVVKIPIPKVTPFGELLFGGSNTNGYTNLVKSINAGGGTISATGTQHPFTMAWGAGLMFRFPIGLPSGLSKLITCCLAIATL